MHETYLQRTLCILIYFQLALLHYLTSFSYMDHLLHLYAVFDAISSNIDEVLLINSSANAFVFGEFNAHYKDWLTYSGGTD